MIPCLPTFLEVRWGGSSLPFPRRILHVREHRLQATSVPFSPRNRGKNALVQSCETLESLAEELGEHEVLEDIRDCK